MIRKIGLGRLVSVVACLIGAGIAIIQPSPFTPTSALAAALAVSAIGLWASAAVPEWFTSLAFFLAAMLFTAAPAAVIFSGFGAAAVWLVFSGLIIGAAVQQTGLGARLAHAIARRLPNTYPGIIGGVVAVTLVLSFVMPSATGRVVLLLPITLALARSYGFERNSNGYVGVVMATCLGAFLPAFAILPANVPNLVLTGASEALYGITPIYGDYFALHFPVLGLPKSILLVIAIVVLFPDRPKPSADQPVLVGPMRPPEWRLAMILAAALAFWMTDFLHHISPGWVGLGAAVACVFPAMGLLTRENFARDINFGPYFYIAGVLGLGGLVAHSGLGEQIAGWLLQLVDVGPGRDFRNFAVLSGTVSLLAMATTSPPVPVVMTPLAESVAASSGLALESVLMLQVVGFSTVFLPYQIPPLMVGLQLSGVPMAKATRLTLTIAALTIVLLLPLDYLWWQALGRFN